MTTKKQLELLNEKLDAIMAALGMATEAATGPKEKKVKVRKHNSRMGVLGVVAEVMHAGKDCHYTEIMKRVNAAGAGKLVNPLTYPQMCVILKNLADAGKMERVPKGVYRLPSARKEVA